MANHRRFHPVEKLIKPCPPTNPDCHCREISTPEGQYQLVHETYLDTIAPQFNTGTHVSIFCPKSTRIIHNHSPACSVHYNSSDDLQYPNMNNSSGELLPPPSSPGEVPVLNLPSPRNNFLDDDSCYFLSKSVSANNNNSSGISPILSPLHPSVTDPHYASKDNHQQHYSQFLQPNNNSATPNTYHNSTSTTNQQRSPSVEKEGFLFNSITNGGSVGSFTSFFGGSGNGSGGGTGGSTSTTTGGGNGGKSRGNSSSNISNISGGSHNNNKKNKLPKTSINKLKSSFIDYITTNEEYNKTMSDTSRLSSCSTFNVGVNFCIIDDKSKLKEPLIRLTFSKAYPTCHDINLVTSSGTEHLDIIIGFNTGDFIWYDPISNRYSRINKNGIMNNSSVTMVKWIPDSEDLFMACFDDGSILILDKDRDDQTFQTREAQSWAEEHFQVTKPGKYGKHNPVAHWRVSKQGVIAFAFSPDKQYVATVGKDGLLRTVEYKTERLCDVFAGYYGRLLCVAWSPDGQYILTGGQDDLITIWSFKESRIIARCQGHRSWVTGVAFDPLHCSGNEFYRFASVGEDCKLLLWDFSVNALHKPKQKTRKFSIAAPSPTADNSTILPSSFSKNKKQLIERQQQLQKQNEANNSKSNSNSVFRRHFKKRSSIFNSHHHSEQEEQKEFLQQQQPSEATQHIQLPTIHPALSKCQVPFIRPIVKQTIHPDPCIDVIYKDDSIVTTDRRGRVCTWARPQ